MNRLIIIGNGFDLAHGMKTSFRDFIEQYLFQCYNKYKKEQKYQDQLIRFGYENTPDGNRIFDITIPELPDTINNLKSIERFKYQSDLFEIIHTKYETLGWVDIEMEYFNILLYIHKSKKDSDEKYNQIIELHKEFGVLKNELLRYLDDVERNYKIMDEDYSDALKSYFFEPTEENEFSKETTDNDIINYYHFLNFNYTNTLEKHNLDDRFKGVKFNYDLNYIHGTLQGSEWGSPIFGFGDEFNKYYKEFENDENYKEMCKYIKSFEYSKHDNYFKLLRFLDSDNFQVQIYGHSCGLTDRTMLKTIFEHEKCINIKIFYYNKEDHKDKVMEIYRHFDDKGKAREKILPEKLSKQMPQKDMFQVNEREIIREVSPFSLVMKIGSLFGYK